MPTEKIAGEYKVKLLELLIQGDGDDTENALLLRELGENRALQFQFDPSLGLYQVQTQEPFSDNATLSIIPLERVVSLVAGLLYYDTTPTFLVQRDRNFPVLLRRTVLRDHNGKPVTEFSPELGKRHRRYTQSQLPCYELLIREQE